MSKSNKDVRISAYVEIEYAIKINELAAASKMSVSEWARNVLMSTVDKVKRNENSVH